jgi:hypothetical protein
MDDTKIDSATRELLERMRMNGTRASASSTAPTPSSASGAVHSTPALTPLNPQLGGPQQPPLPPAGSSGGGNGGSNGSGRSWLDRLPKGNQLDMFKFILGVLLLIGVLKIGNYFSEINRESADSHAVKEMAMDSKQVDINLKKAQAELVIAKAQAETKAIKEGKAVAQELVTAQTFSCTTREEVEQGFKSAQLQIFSESFSIPQQCALIQISGRVTRVEGYDFSFEYPDIQNPGNVFSCGPDKQVKDCDLWLNTIHSDSRYMDKRVRAIVKGSVKIFQKE